MSWIYPPRHVQCPACHRWLDARYFMVVPYHHIPQATTTTMREECPGVGRLGLLVMARF